MNQVHRILIAENQELTRVFNQMIATASYFEIKAFPTNKPFNICDFAAQDTTLCCGACAEYLNDPAIR